MDLEKLVRESEDIASKKKDIIDQAVEKEKKLTKIKTNLKK